MNITLKIVEGRYVMQKSNVIDINDVRAAAIEKQKKENQQQIKLNLKKEREGEGGEN